jgi:hypothetical protein
VVFFIDLANAVTSSSETKGAHHSMGAVGAASPDPLADGGDDRNSLASFAVT